MRKTLFVTVMMVAAALFCAFQASAQTRPLLGGYKEIAKTDAAVKKAALFAVSAEAKRTEKEIEFISIVKAERQVVAGSNYRMCLKVSTEGAEGQDDTEVFVKVVVYVDLKGVQKLTSWEASDCGEDAEGDEASPSSVGSAPGGDFKTVPNKAAGIGLAADFAVKKHSEDTKVEHTLTSILKGEEKGMFAMTYRICMKVAEKNESHVVSAVVTKDQYSNMKLVSWQHSKCGN